MRRLAPLILLVCAAPLAAQTRTAGGSACPGLAHTAALDCVAQTYAPASTYSYSRARDTLFAAVDDGDRLRITDLYTGRVLPIASGQDPTTAGCDGDRDGNPSSCSNARTINTEHVWPQSYGAGQGSAKSDLHHLWPARGDVNSARGNKPFGEFAYSLATRLYADTTDYGFAQAGADTLLYSAVSSKGFMPRASVRGDVARALFYFRAVYRSEVDGDGARQAWFDGMRATLPTRMSWTALPACVATRATTIRLSSTPRSQTARADRARSPSNS
jgi:hypothetical protein